MTVKKNEKFIFTISFILSLSLFLLLEAYPLELLAEDLFQRNEEEVKIEVLLSEPQEQLSGDINESSQNQGEQELNNSEVSETLKEAETKNELSENIEAAEQIIEDKPEEKPIEKVQKKEDNNTSNFISNPDEEKKDETDIKNEIVEEKPVKEEEEIDEEKIIEKEKIIEEIAEPKKEQAAAEEEVVEDNKQEIEDKDEMPAWLAAETENKENNEKSSSNEKDSSQRFDLEKYLAELEASSNTEESNADLSNEADQELNSGSEIEEIKSDDVVDEDNGIESGALESDSDIENTNSAEAGAAVGENTLNEKVYDLREAENSSINKPKISSYKQPVYPSQMIEREIEGMVKISLKIDQNGNSSEFEIYESSGYKLFDKAALKAVENWRFEAAQLNNDKVSVKILVPIRFELR